MKRKKIWAMKLAVAMLLGNILFVNAEENKVIDTNSLQETLTNLQKGYSEYYDILNTETTLCSSHEIDGNIENIYFLDMEVVLKADSVEEMDYYQGIAEYNQVATAQISNLKNEDSELRIDTLYSEQSDIYDDLKEYIGEVRSLTFFIKEIYPINNEAEKEILFENGSDYVSWEEMLPASHDELRANGYATMADIDTKYLLMKENEILQSAAASYSYSVDDAVTYMKRYTSNASTCYVCYQTNCTSKSNFNLYNNNVYDHYASTHSDCANYVSQALCEGGIPTDSTWKPKSNTWAGVTALINYMTSNAYWTSVTYNVVQKGDIMKLKSESHIVMITSFDGVTYGYSGHTHDRRDSTISITSSTGYYYRVR